jgi:hypothetical protein
MPLRESQVAAYGKVARIFPRDCVAGLIQILSAAIGGWFCL